MKRIALALAAVLSLQAAPAVAEPASGAELIEPTNASAGCRPDQASWIARSRPADLATPPVTRPPNTETYVWACQVDGRSLVVRHRIRIKGSWDCSATYVGEVSAWIDGVKIVKTEPMGDYDLCMAGEEPFEAIVVSMTLETGGRLTVCRLAGNREATRQVCDRVVTGGARDPEFFPPDHRTSPALVLNYDGAAVCKALTPWMALTPALMVRDESLDPFAVPSTQFWNRPEQVSAPDAARFDIDNDGRLDEVTLERSMRAHGQDWGEIRWRPTDSAGAPFVSGDLPRRVGDLGRDARDSFTRFVPQPIILEGRTYVYLRRLPIEGADDLDYESSADNPTLITRGLVELTPDGKTRALCAWGPKVRPEERL